MGGKRPKSELEIVCDRLRITAKVVTGNHADTSQDADNWRRNAFAWTVHLARGGERLSVAYWTGRGNVHKRSDGKTVAKEPTAADVLCSLAIDARAGEMTFEDYCSDFGISTDSRQAHATWVECVAMARRLRVFLGAHFDEVANAEH